jgi:hypothetical protein
VCCRRDGAGCQEKLREAKILLLELDPGGSAPRIHEGCREPQEYQEPECQSAQKHFEIELGWKCALEYARSGREQW